MSKQLFYTYIKYKREDFIRANFLQYLINKKSNLKTGLEIY